MLNGDSWNDGSNGAVQWERFEHYEWDLLLEMKSVNSWLMFDCQWDLMVGNDGDKEMEEGSKWLSKDPKGIWVMQTMYLTIVKWSRKHMSIICYLRF